MNEGRVLLRDSTNFILGIPFQADGGFMCGLIGPTPGMVSWQISGAICNIGDNTGQTYYNCSIPDSQNNIIINNIQRINFITVSDAVLTLWGPDDTGLGGCQITTQALVVRSQN